MTVPFFAVLGLLILLLTAYTLVKSSPAALAGAIRTIGPIVIGLTGLGLTFAGRASLGGMMMAGALAWWGANRRMTQSIRTPGHRSIVRTALLEMELDHDTGSLDGVVLAGPFEGTQLGSMDLPDLLELYDLSVSDGESRELLETYLDGRFTVWRDDAETNSGGGQSSTPGTGTMTEKEAYEILGLEVGASAADIRKAHRSLMQRVHPDLGGSSFLAARINAAKDILLKHHH